jgi:hypothetical protein
LCRHVERGQGPLVDETADAQAVPDLVAREPVEKLLVEGSAAAPVGGHIALFDETAPDPFDFGTRVAGTERHLLRHGIPAAGRHDVPVALNGKLDRGDRGLAHERAVEAVVGAQAVVEFGALLLASRFLLRRDRPAIGEARIGIEALREGSLRRQQACCKQGRGEGLCVERRGAPSCRARDNHARKKRPSL